MRSTVGSAVGSKVGIAVVVVALTVDVARLLLMSNAASLSRFIRIGTATISLSLSVSLSLSLDADNILLSRIVDLSTIVEREDSVVTLINVRAMMRMLKTMKAILMAIMLASGAGKKRLESYALHANNKPQKKEKRKKKKDRDWSV